MPKRLPGIWIVAVNRLTIGQDEFQPPLVVNEDDVGKTEREGAERQSAVVDIEAPTPCQNFPRALNDYIIKKYITINRMSI